MGSQHQEGAGVEDPAAVSRARARKELQERAEALLTRLGRAPSPRERFWFIVDARKDGLFVKGESSEDLARVWVLGTNAVERTACEVDHALVDPAALEVAREHVAIEARRRADEIYERAQAATDRAAGPLYAASNAALETFGKVTQAIAPAGAVNILVDARTGQLKPEVARAMEDANEMLLGAARRAAIACGISGEDLDAALAAEMEAPALVGRASDG